MGRISPIGIPLSGRVASRLRIPDPTFSLRMSNRIVASYEILNALTRAWCFFKQLSWTDAAHQESVYTVPMDKIIILNSVSVVNTANVQCFSLQLLKETNFHTILWSNPSATNFFQIYQGADLMLEGGDQIYASNTTHTGACDIMVSAWGRILDLARVD